MGVMDNDIRPRLAKRPPAPARAPAYNKQAELSTAAVFKTPEEVAAEQALRDASEATQQNDAPKDNGRTTGHGGWKEKLKLRWPPSKKEWITSLAILLLVAGGITGYILTHKSKPATLKPIPKVTSQTKTVPSTLTGLPVDPTVNQRTVTGVMIENTTFARPQSGLGQAGVVFEAVAEAGITRFLALYQDTAPDNIGPIRSARPYYVQWLLGFDAGYAHVGGSPDALGDIKTWGVHDLDEFANGGSYHRIGSRVAPHNVYTSISTLNQLEVSKGYTTSHYTGFARKKKAFRKKTQPITAKSINMVLSGPTYDAHYDYDAKSNSYMRSEGGAAHIDANTNNQISPVVVIAMVTPESQGALDATGAYYSNYNVIGSGPVYIFQDGTVTTGQWNKGSNTAQLTFTDAAGKAILLNPGQTWITAVSGSGKVSYAP